MGPISKNQTLVSVVAITALTVLVGLHDIDPATYVAVVSAMLGNAIGYINGKKNGSNNEASK